MLSVLFACINLLYKKKNCLDSLIYYTTNDKLNLKMNMFRESVSVTDLEQTRRDLIKH